MLVAEKNLLKSYSVAALLPWAIVGLYIIVALAAMNYHEPWGDEIHSWNIAKGSGSFADLMSNIRYEGHPPVWYSILWIISKFTHNLAYVQIVHLIIAILTIFIIVFFSPVPLSTRILIPFGYYFVFEYAVISRNYAVGVLLAFCICAIIRKNFRYKNVLYYLLLFLLTNTHLLAILLAAALHFYFLVLQAEWKQKRSIIVLHALLGLLAALPSLYFIFPPSDSQLNVQFWLNHWDVHHLTAFGQAPLFAFLPIPAWWHYQSWNTQFLIEAKSSLSVLRPINLLIAATLPLLAVVVLIKNKKATLVFLINFFLSFLIAVAVFPMTAERYAGFIFIGFVVAYWLYCSETLVTPGVKSLVNGFLIIQLLGSAFIIPKDIQHSFSNAYRVNELLKEVPPGEQTVTDYWAMNTISAFTDNSFYCIDLQKQISFIQWNSDLGAMQKRRYRYYEGVTSFFQRNNVNRLYMISTGSPKVLFKVDSALFKSYHVTLSDKREGAIEKGGNIYLYRISSL